MIRKEFIQKIQSNIESSGQHVTIVSGGQEPRYAYTIGNKKNYNLEFIFAGGSYFFEEDVYKIFNVVSKEIVKFDKPEDALFLIDSLGAFKLRKVDSSWSKITMLGVFDYYGINKVNAYQILPDKEHYTLDIPDMSLEWKASENTPWKWLKDDWEYKIPKTVSVVTNLDALKGDTITEVMRWEDDEWEMFAGAGPDVDEKDIRVIPIGSLFSIDKSLESALDLKIGKGMWRKDKMSEWNAWG